MDIHKGILGILLLAAIIASIGTAAAIQDPYPMNGLVVYANGGVAGANVTFTNVKFLPNR